LKALFSASSFVAAGLWSAILPTNAQVNVTQYHNHMSRDGLYIDFAAASAEQAVGCESQPDCYRVRCRNA
jgi:hypothetical protein